MVYPPIKTNETETFDLQTEVSLKLLMYVWWVNHTPFRNTNKSIPVFSFPVSKDRFDVYSSRTLQIQLDRGNSRGLEQALHVYQGSNGTWPAVTSMNSKQGFRLIYSDLRDRSLFIAQAGTVGGDLVLNKVRFSRSPLWMSFHWSDPPDNFWWLSRPPPPPALMSSFAKQIWVVPPLNPSKVFSDPPFWVLSYDWSP